MEVLWKASIMHYHADKSVEAKHPVSQEEFGNHFGVKLGSQFGVIVKVLA